MMLLFSLTWSPNRKWLQASNQRRRKRQNRHIWCRSTARIDRQKKRWNLPVVLQSLENAILRRSRKKKRKRNEWVAKRSTAPPRGIHLVPPFFKVSPRHPPLPIFTKVSLLISCHLFSAIFLVYVWICSIDNFICFQAMFMTRPIVYC